MGTLDHSSVAARSVPALEGTELAYALRIVGRDLGARFEEKTLQNRCDVPAPASALMRFPTSLRPRSTGRPRDLTTHP